MKKIFNIKTAAAGMILLLAAGCADNFLDTAIDRDPTPETIATNRNTIWEFANAMYVPMEYGFTSLNGNLFAAATDEAQETVISADALAFTQAALTSTNNPLWERYRQCYEGIRAANFFLNYVADGKGLDLLKLNRDIIRDKVNYERDVLYLGYTIAEAYVLKAYYYGELIKMYGGVPIVESLYQYDKGDRYEQKSYDEVLTYILKLIDDHIGDMAVNWAGDTGRNGRLTQDAALAIKARILLYAASPRNNDPESTTYDAAKWAAAAAAADEIIKKGTFSLHGDYGAYFKGANTITSAETILAVRKASSNDPEKRNYPIATAGGNSGVTPTHNLVKAYEQLDGTTPDPYSPYSGKDPRLAASIVVQGDMWNGRTIDQSSGGKDDMSNLRASRTGYYLKKFLQENLNLTQGQTDGHYWPAYRYAEVLLNFAEAANEELGPDDRGPYTLTALEALQLVRNRASTDLPPISTLNKVELRELIKHERRIELAFEGHRYWDLNRWGDSETVLNQPVTGVTITKIDNSRFTIKEREVAVRRFDASKNYYMPFDRAEIVNSNGGITQNKDYE